MSTLRPIGRLVPAGADGILPRIGGPAAAVPSAMALAVAHAAEGWHPVGAVVLRGSAARGTWVDGASDVDLVLLSDEDWPVDYEARIHDDPGVAEALDGTPLDATCLTIKELKCDPRAAGLRFHLAFCATTVEGRDVLPGLPDPRLGPDAMVHLPRAERWRDLWAREAPGVAPGSEEARILCGWVCKRLVRSAFEAVMLDLNAYGRDLHPCLEAASEALPDLAPDLRQAAEQVVSRGADPGKVNGLVRRITPRLIKARDRRAMALKRKRPRPAARPLVR